MVDRIKDFLIEKLFSISIINGYNNDIKKIYGSVKTPREVNIDELPAISIFCTMVRPIKFDESEYAYELYYGILIFAENKNDLEDNNVETSIISIYDDIVNLFLYDKDISIYEDIIDYELNNLFIAFDSTPLYGTTILKLIIK